MRRRVERQVVALLALALAVSAACAPVPRDAPTGPRRLGRSGEGAAGLGDPQVAASATSTISFLGSFDGDVRDLPPVASPPRPEEAEEERAAAPDLRVPPMTARAQTAAAITGRMPSASLSFNGLSYTGYLPPDAVGDVGPDHYVEAVNTKVGIYSKAGTSLATFTFDTLWQGRGTLCDGSSYGDPTVVYDPMHDRWIVADFAFGLSGGNPVAPYYECIAVSKTGDPVAGGWWFYAIRADDISHPWMNDYPKMSVWPGSLVITANMFAADGTYEGVRVWALNLADIEAGLTARMQVKDLSDAYFSLLPVNLRGTLPPNGTPVYLIAQSYQYFAFEVWKWSIDWSGPSSTLTGPTYVSQTPYTPGWGEIVPQPGDDDLDVIDDRLMMQAQYRNIGGVESIWVAHAVRTSGSSPTGIQWAQVNVTGGTIATAPVQQGVWSGGADGRWRWIPSLAVDQAGNMALGYSVSGSTTYPGIRYAGRLAGDTLNSLGQAEATLIAGTTSQVSGTRWGDYTAMTVDSVDDCTFWYVGPYIASGTGLWTTRIGTFTFPTCGSRTVTVTKAGTGSGTVTSSPAGISCPGTCSSSFTGGTDVSLSASASSGSIFSGWSGTDAASCSGTSCAFTAISAAHQVTAIFSLPATYTVTVGRTGTGTVRSTPSGISCGSTCSGPFPEGTSVTLTATPASGWVFASWSGDCAGTGTTCTLTMDAAKSVTANFGRRLSLTKTPAAAGAVSSNVAGISCGTSCASQTAVYPSGQTVVLTATPEAGYSFRGWAGSCSGISTTCTLSMSAARTVTATFGAVLSLTKNLAAAGSISSSPSGIKCQTSCASASATFVPGAVITLTATISKGWTSVAWSGCTPVVGQPRRCVLTLSTATTVTATFA